MTEDHEYETQREAVDEATAQRGLAIGILAGNTLTPRGDVVVPPYTVETLVENHLPVYVERGLGQGAGLIDLDYADAGAILAADADELYRSSDLLVCLRPLSIEEMPQLRDHQILITPVRSDEVTADHLSVLQLKSATALSLRMIRNVEGGELLQDILLADGGAQVSGDALGDLLLSMIFPLVFNSRWQGASRENPALFQALYCYRGVLTREEIAFRLQLPFQQIGDLL